MKILLFANTDWYLYNFCSDLAEALRRRGDEVVLVSPPGPYAQRLVASGFRWLAVPLSRRSLNPLTELRCVTRLVGLYRREAPDLVHHFTVKCVLYGSLAGRLADVYRRVNSITGLGYVFMEGGSRPAWLRWLVQVAYRLLLRGTWVIFQNQEDREFFLGQGLADPERAVLVHGLGIDLARFSPCPKPTGRPLVILPGRMLWDKGVGEFVEAARALRARNIPGRFALVGDADDGNPASIPASRLTDWVSEGAVEWWGWQEDMQAAYAQATIVCLPSYREGVPRTLIEAAACGLPIVASDVPGCREVARPGENGLLVPPRDAIQLAEALGKLLQDPALCERLGAAGRLLAERNFSLAGTLAQTMEIYRQTEGGL